MKCWRALLKFSGGYLVLSSDYSVYKHTNSKNGKVYIGITRQPVERRWQKGAGYANTYFGNAISKYGWDSFTHEVILTGLDKETACRVEIELISAYNANDREHGYNIAEGGNTADCVRVKSGAENPRAAAVRRIDPVSGETVIYKTIKAACDDLRINHRGISKACRGISQTYKGYIWEYADGEVKKRPAVGIGNYDHKKQRKRVKLTEPDGAESFFDSINAAGEALGIRPNTISRYLLGIRADASGRRWSYCL